jgi:hypothetical protein
MTIARNSNLMALGAAILIAAHSLPVHADSKFPNVDQTTQKARDDTRKQILESELATETKAADDAAKAVLAAQQSKQPATVISDLQQSAESHGKNVEALKKELASIGTSPTAPTLATSSPYKVPARLVRASLDTSRPTPYWDVYHRPQPTPSADSDDASRPTTPPATAQTN